MPGRRGGENEVGATAPAGASWDLGRKPTLGPPSRRPIPVGQRITVIRAIPAGRAIADGGAAGTCRQPTGDGSPCPVPAKSLTGSGGLLSLAS